MTRSVRVPLLLFLGSLLVQSAWILALPPFRGTDEFDHAFRAAAVAGGQWRSPGVAATDGRGDLVRVPRTLVAAAHPVCASYDYTGHDNCNPVADAGAGMVEVASASATYNPVFYWVVGSVGRPFHGAGALYAMRMASALLCALFLALAGWVTTLWARSSWPLAALVVVLSPVMVFSTSVLAPNGLEMCAALSLWMAMLGFHTSTGRHDRAPALLVVATLSAVVLTTLRSIGPLWLGLIVLTVLLPLGPTRVTAVIRRNRVVTAVCSVVVLAAGAASVLWTRSAGTNTLEPYQIDIGNRLTATLDKLPLWSLQTIAAFPRKLDAAPGIVYVLVGATFLALVLAGFSVARGRLRLVIVASAVITMAVPLVVTFLTIRFSGPFWQGRYGLPYALGIGLTAGVAFDEARTRQRRVAPVLVAGWLALAVAQAVSAVHVLNGELRTSPLAGTSAWATAPAVVVAGLMVAGVAAWGLAVAAGGSSSSSPPQVR